MRRISIPCHACGQDNSIDAFYCSNCRTVIRLRLQPTTTTQLATVQYQSPEEKLLQEAYLIAALLLQSANRLRAMLDQASTRD
jgi:hypothetical protein